MAGGDAEFTVLYLLQFAMLLLHVFALFDVAIRKAALFPAADKQTKALWLTLLGLAVATDLAFGLYPLGLFPLAGTVAALVYLVDVRPAVRAARGSGGGWGRGRRPSGPRGGRPSGPRGGW